MVIILILLGEFLYRVSSTPCYEECICYPDIMNCSKKSLRELPNFPDKVTKLDFSENLIYQLGRGEQFQDIKQLDLSHNRLRVIHIDLSKSYMKILKLSDNPLNQIFISSTMLKVLDISWCDLTYIGSGFLEKLPSLEVLDVSNNPLKKIEPLNGNLKDLYANKCSLHDIKFNLPHLNTLDISHNSDMQMLKLESNLTILKASHGSFSHMDLLLPKVIIMDISHNKFSYVNLSSFSLEELNLSSNLLRSFSLSPVDGLLSKLDLSRNSLSELNLNIRGLRHLNVSNNPLSTLIVSSRSMSLVDGSFCQLKQIDLPTVYTLNLSRNNLESFTGDATILDLSHNLLDTFNSNAKFVDLRGNRLSLPKKVSISGSALLGNNPWLCVCDDTSLKELYMKALDKVTCASPEGRTWESCYNTKLPKYMKDYPWVPLAASGFLTVLVIIGVCSLKNKLWTGRSAVRSSNESDEISYVEPPVRIRIDDQLPSYEEALLMNKPRYSNRRSYEIVPNRRLSSSSI